MTPYRTDWETAANAIIGQLLQSYEELVRSVDSRNPLPETLRDFLVAAGRERAGMDPLVVIVDGLDHVWRDTGSAEGLRRLFDLLLPAPDGVVVVVGTQDIEPGQLPRKLRDLCPRDRWLRVPVLDGDGVHEWLQHHKLELALPEDEDHSARVLGELAEAFRDVSGGHPLILHYTLGATRQGTPWVRAEDVRALPSFDPDSNVADYYRALWDTISPEGHHLLHLLAGFPWAWPRDGLVQCLAPQSDPARLEQAERAIWQVLGTSRAGVTAFHESLLAFIRALPEHESTARTLRPQVIEWLAHRAPDYWRWRYEWEERAKIGNTGPLISSTTLDWCVDSLVAGRGRTEVARMVAASGWAALDEGRLGVATERHYIDTYLGEARHSESVLARLLWLALNGLESHDRELELDLFLSHKVEASNAEIHTAAELAFSEGLPALCQELLEEGKERWNAALRRSDMARDTFWSLEQTLPALIAASLTTPANGPYRRYVSEHEDEPEWCLSENYAKALARLCVVGGDTRAIRTELCFLANQADRVSFEAVDEIVRLAWRDGFDPDRWIENPEARRSGLFRCDRVWVRHAVQAPAEAPREISFSPVSYATYHEAEDLFVELAHAYFFSCLASAAEGHGPAEPIGVGVEAFETRKFLSMLRNLAAEAAACKQAGETVGAAWLLHRITTMDPPDVKLYDHRDRFVQSEPVARVVVAIAQDLEELEHVATGERFLGEDAVILAIDGTWTWPRIWIEDRVQRRLTMDDPDAARLLIDRERERLRNSRDHLHKRAEEYASLAQFCQLHQAPADEVGSLAHLAAKNLLGHGFHKDTVLFDLLGAIEAASGLNNNLALAHLQAISPVIQVVDEITDSDETRHLKRELAATVRQIAPEALPPYLRALQYGYHHWQVETCFTDLAKHSPLGSSYERALATTLVHEDALSALHGRADSGDSDAESVLVEVLAYLGRQAADPDDGPSSSGIPSEEPDGALPPVEDYPPERMVEFERAVRAAGVYGDGPLAAWTTYWRTQEPDGLLTALTEYRTVHGMPYERETGKAVVELALERAGLSAAWEWLVAYHAALYGWHYFYRQSDVQWIWEFVRTRFSGRWLDFITETSRSRWTISGSAPSWSSERMVGFLEVVEQADRVEEVLDAAFRWGAGLAADMPLPEPALTLDQPELPVALRLLVDRLDNPSRTVQERTAWSLACLLADEVTRDAATKALVDWHAREQLEMRSCMLLVLLHLAHNAHNLPVGDCVSMARGANLVPSVGADLLLREFGEEGATLAASLDYRTRYSRRPAVVVSGSDDFGSAVRGHLARIFLMRAHRLERDGIPFSRQWKWEATRLARQQGLSLEPNAHFNYHYWGGADEPMLAINDRLSSLLRSAYLRALHWSIEEAALDVGRAEDEALLVAVMVDPTLWAVRPSKCPNWWPEDPVDEDTLDTLGEAVGRSVRNRIERRDPDEGKVLLFAAGPVGSRSHLRAEVTVEAFLQATHGPIRPSQTMLTGIPEVKAWLTPTRLSVPGTYTTTEQYADLIGDWMMAPLAWRLVTDTKEWVLPERQIRGLYVPARWLVPESPTIVTEPSQVSFTFGDQRIARYRYWNDELRERNYSEAGSRVGVELVASREWLEPHLHAGATLCWVVSLSIAQREEYNDQFGEQRVVGTWLVGGSHVMWPEPWLPPSLE